MKKYASILSVGLVIIVIFGTIYIAMQQSQRSAADLPQIQLAQDGAILLNKNQPPRIFSGTYVDVSKSLATWTNVYELSGAPVTGSGYLDGSLASVPKSVLNAANGTEYSSVTWEPKSGLRIATVVVKSEKYYVLSGRSLHEVGKTESKTLVLSVVGGLLSIAIASTYFAIISPEIALPKLKKNLKKAQKTDHPV